MATDLTTLLGKVANGGINAQGKLTAAEFNKLVTAVMECQVSEEELSEALERIEEERSYIYYETEWDMLTDDQQMMILLQHPNLVVLEGSRPSEEGGTGASVADEILTVKGTVADEILTVVGTVNDEILTLIQ